MHAILDSVLLHMQYELNLILGKTYEKDAIRLSGNYRRIYRTLIRAFMSYEPGERDYVKTAYLRRQIIPPHPTEMREQAAKWAVDVIVTIDLMKKGMLPPDSFMPLIKPTEIPYYSQRLQTYLGWLLSENPEEQRRPIPFFYDIAAERLNLQMKQGAMETINVDEVEIPELATRRQTRGALVLRHA